MLTIQEQTTHLITTVMTITTMTMIITFTLITTATMRTMKNHLANNSHYREVTSSN